MGRSAGRTARIWVVGAACAALAAADAGVPRPLGSTPVRIPIEVAAGDLLRAEVRALGVDLTLELVDPGGVTLAASDDRPTTEGVETIWAIAAVGGRHELVVASRWGEAGEFRVESLEHRPAAAAERERAVAEVALRELTAARLDGRDPAAGFARSSEVRASFERLGLFDRAVRTLVEEAIFLRRLQRADEAGELLVATLDDARRRGETIPELQMLNALAVRAYSGGDISGAVARGREALAAAERSGERYRVALAGVNLALYLSYAGANRESLEGYQRACIDAEAVGWLDGQATCWFNVALAHEGLRDYGAVFEALRRADRLFARVGKPVDQGRMRSSEGTLFLQLGDPERAAERFRQVLELVPAVETEEIARAQANLGQAALASGDLDGARREVERALETMRELSNPNLRGAALVTLSEIALRQGRVEEAVACAREAATLARASGAEQVLPSALVALGEALTRARAHAEAAVPLAEALESSRRKGDLELVAAARDARARLVRANGDPRAALAEVEAGIEAIEAVRAEVPTLELQATLLARFRRLFDLAIELRAELERREPGRGHAQAAFNLAERARARSLLAALPALGWRSDEPTRRLRRAGAELADRRAELRRVEADAAARVEAKNEAVRTLDLALTAYGAARAEWLGARGAQRGRLDRPVRSLAEVQAAIAPDELLLEYHVGFEAAFLFVVGRARFELVSLGPTAELEAEVAALLPLLTKPSALGARAYRDAAFALHRRVVAPARPNDSLRRLAVSPDGALRQLPFGALVASETGARFAELDYLALRQPLLYFPSASVALELREQPKDSESPRLTLAAFGDPPAHGAARDADVRRAVDPLRLPPLPGAREEVARVAKLLAPSAVWVGAEASEARFRGLVAEPPRRIHLATHALVDERRPELSAIWLAAGEGEDGWLEAWEVASLKLPIEQVVLAACASALGRPIAGEGLVGLVQAFFDAGARSVLATLWPVADRSTGDLMIDYYRALGEHAPEAALARAVSGRIARGGAGAHPYYWAPFVLAGSGR